LFSGLEAKVPVYGLLFSRCLINQKQTNKQNI
jgi:hypothetical protein